MDPCIIKNHNSIRRKLWDYLLFGPFSKSICSDAPSAK
jgi:hypothetical protein